MSQTYTIEGMHCQACVRKISSALSDVAEEVNVTLSPPQAVVGGGSEANADALNKAVARVGNYTLKPQAPAAAAPVVKEEPKNWLKTYYPLFLIIGLIAVVSFKGAGGLHDWMLHFMAGFFIVFSFFKLLDINGFKDAYGTYDLLAKRWSHYGYVYPFLELGLGLAFLFQFQLTAALWCSIVLMGFGSLGVIQALSEKRQIRCACLGTVLNLPMSTITLVEDLGMVAMSGLMLAAVI